MTKSNRREFLESCLAGIAAAPGVQGQTRQRPNFLFFFPDQNRWDWSPAHHSGIRMPALTRLMQGAVTFDRAHCASPVCAPSRACLATGQEYDRCGVRRNDESFPIASTTVYERLRRAGYRTLACGKIDLATGELVAGRGLGTDGRRFTREWGFTDAIVNAGKQAGAKCYLTPPVGPKDAYYAYLDALSPSQGRLCAEDFQRRNAPKELVWTDTTPSPLAEEHYLDNWIGRNGLALLDRAPKDEPWFLIVNFAGPHYPMDIPRRLERLYRGPDRVVEAFDQPHGYSGTVEAAHHVRIRQNYAAMLENIDRWLGVYLERLRERGDLERTIVVYASDHGEMLGDRGRWGKELPYESSLGVPLCISGPGIRPRRSTALVSLIDLTATLLDYAGVERPKEMQGFSLRPLLEGRAQAHREYLLSGLYDWRLVRNGRYKLITQFEGAAARLYDLEEDPWEERDLAPADPGLVGKLQQLMRAGSYRPA